MSNELQYFPITHAHIRPYQHPNLNITIDGRSTVRYLRFLRRVAVDRLEIAPNAAGRWTPSVPAHPAHLTVAVLDSGTAAWRVIKEIHPPPDTRIAGAGLSPETSTDEMEAHFQRVLAEARPICIDLAGVETDLLRVECDREHPVWPNHGEIYAQVHSVPFGALDKLKVFGRPIDPEIPDAVHLPVLTRGEFKPEAPRGMTCRQKGEMILFSGKKLSIGFALRRPLLLHLGWDALARGKTSFADLNRLANRRIGFKEANRGVSGPLLVTPRRDYGAHLWTGRIYVAANSVRYTNLTCDAGVTLDVTFHVFADRVDMELVQRALRPVVALEYESWRLAFALKKGMTGVAGLPTRRTGRAGDTETPALFCGDSIGALSCRRIENKSGILGTAGLQVESYRPSHEVIAGLLLASPEDRGLGAPAAAAARATPPADRCLTIPAGEQLAKVVWEPVRLQPVRGSKTKGGKAATPGPGVLRHWTSNFSCFRPEWAGFSNHAASCNCHVNQHGPIDVAVFTRKPRYGPDPLKLAQFTIERALNDGSGYGYHRNLYKDSDPVLVCAAGRIHQARPSKAWLQTIAPGLIAAVERILDTLGGEGLALCRELSGNAGSFRWSSNAWDIVGFGHMDAYVNAWTYRALRNAAALLRVLGVRHQDLARRSEGAAEKLRANFAQHLVNPATGWVICWKSRDGQLHDYASLWINGAACAFGVVDDVHARRALGNLERLRAQTGLQSARLGSPYMLLPMHPLDHMLPKIMGGGKTEPTFELFTDGSMAPSAVQYYLRALSLHGFVENARQMAADLDAGFADGLFTGGSGTGMGEGNEFLSWEGLQSGYEGTFGPNFGVLYAIAIQQGLLTPPDPEWWPNV